MAISLNNHESRIKILESNSNNKSYIGLNTSYDVNLDIVNKAVNIDFGVNIAEYDLLIFNANVHKKNMFGLQQTISLKRLLDNKFTVIGIQYTSGGGVVTEEFKVEIASTTSINLTCGLFSGNTAISVGSIGVRDFCLLKLYYNFSYNKLVQFLSHLNTKFGGERR